jgi:transcriptional regulator with XRE-family HTH domain
MDTKNLKIIGERLKAAREKQKLTQADVATATGIAVNYYAMVERGETNLTYEKINKLYNFLKLKNTDIPL